MGEWKWLYSSAYNFGGYKEYRAWLGWDIVNYATYSRCWWSIGVQMKYGSEYGVTAVASGAASGSCEGYLSSSPGGKWKDVCRKDSYFDVTRTTSSQTRKVTSTAKGKTVSGYGSAGGSGVSVSKTYTIPALDSYTVSYNANGGSGAPSSQTKWYGKTLTLSSAKPTRAGYTFLGWSTSSTATSATYAAGGSYTANSGATLYAVWKIITYTVSYNANNGSGAPSAQTKTYNVTLKLSSTVPTRTGYDFLGWSTSNTATSATYAAGGNYTTNATTTLYAVWRLKTYTVSYNANGGNGAPANQTKTYGTTLTLTSAIPTKTNYDFVNWNTKSDGTGTSYNKGGSYTANEGTTLYATWKLSYVKPKITIVSSTRTPNADSKNIALSFNWFVSDLISTNHIESIKINYKEKGSSGDYQTLITYDSFSNQYSGTINYTSTGNLFNTDKSYDIQIIVEDTIDSSIATAFISTAFFTIDFKKGGKSIAFGSSAPDNFEGFTCAMSLNLIDSAITSFKSYLLDYVYPVGSIYMSVNSTSPQTFLGGTWTRLTDTFLLAAGSTYAADNGTHTTATGGAASVSYTPACTVGNHTLQTSEIPAHTHGSKTLTGDAQIYSDMGVLGAKGSGTGVFSKGALVKSTAGPQWRTDYASYKLHIDASHTHDSVGGGGAHNHGFTGTAASIKTMPPYLPVYVWKRTA